MTTSACFEQNTEAPESPEAFYIELKANKYFFSSLIKVVKVQNIVIKVCVHMLFIEMLLAVQRKLLAADGTYPPVRLHVLFETALLKVWREDHLTQGTPLMNIRSEWGRKIYSHIRECFDLQLWWQVGCVKKYCLPRNT